MKVLISTGFKEYGYKDLAIEFVSKQQIQVTLFTGFVVSAKLAKTKAFQLIKKFPPFASMNIRVVDFSILSSLYTNPIIEIIDWIGAKFHSEKIQSYARNVYKKKLSSCISKFNFDILILRPGFFPSDFNGAKVYSLLGIAHPDYIVDKLKKSGLSTDSYNSKLWKSTTNDLNISNAIIINSDFIKKTFPVGLQEIPTYTLSNPLCFNKEVKNIGARKKKSVLFVGEIGLRKGFDIVMDVMNVLFKEGYTLTCIGNVERSFYSRFQNWCNYHQNFNYLYHIKSVSHDELLKIYPYYEYFIFPTRAEGSSRAVQEAMLFGLIVLTNITCGVHITHNNSGILLDDCWSSPSIVLDKLKHLTDDQMTKIRIAARATILSNYSYENYTRQVNSIISSFNN